jgi:predicted nucleic acid-binding Zn finger protein
MYMQQLETSKQILEEEQKYKRECKGRSLALTRNVYRLVNTDVFYVESESSNDIYYSVKFKDILEWCSCPDNLMRVGSMRCKHIWACEHAIRLGILRDTDRLLTATATTTIQTTKSSYKDDDYSF